MLRREDLGVTISMHEDVFPWEPAALGFVDRVAILALALSL